MKSANKTKQTTTTTTTTKKPGADCGSDHELFIDKFRLKQKKVRENQQNIQV